MVKVLLILVLLGLVPVIAAPGDDPRAVVEGFQAALLAVMQEADELGYEGRYQRLAPVVQASHDLAGIARVTLGRHWNRLSSEQQAAFVDTFSRLSIATYAHRFADYGGEAFKILSAEQPEAGKAIVHTRLLDADGEEVNLDYLLRPVQDAGWQIINVTYDGISDLALKRSEYTSVIRNQGVEALIAKLQEKIAQYENAAS